MNPHKWKRYSLSDADISERSNTSAAFQFLAEIEKKKRDDSSQDEDELEDSSDKIVFNNRRKSQARKPSFNSSASLRNAVEKDNEVDAEKPVLKGSKLVMPEYVVGQRNKSKDKKRPHAPETSTRKTEDRPNKRVLQLQHLMEDEDEED